MVQAVLFDIDGVIFQGDQVIPGAEKTIAWFQEHDVPHLFVTNTSSIPRKDLVTKLARAGIGTDEGRILTPAVTANHWIKQHANGPVALFVTESTQSEFQDLEILDQKLESGAAVVVIGDLGNDWTFEKLNRAFRLLMSEPKPALMALGMTRYWHTQGRLQLDVAPFVVALEHASGVKAVVVGKPAREFFDSAVELLGVSTNRAVMIGDDIRGDIKGALDAGLQGVLVKTGKFKPSDLTQGIEPNAVIDSIAGFPDWWMSQQTCLGGD